MVILLRLTLLAIVLLVASSQYSLNSALSNDSNNEYKITDSCIIKAQKSILDGDYQTAMQVYEEVIFVNNITDIKLYNNFGALLMNIQNYTYAANIFDMAMALSAKNASNATDNIDERSLVYYNMGWCQMVLHNLNQSKLMFEQSISMNRSISLKLSYHGLGLLLWKHFNDYANATKMFETVLNLDTTNVQTCIEMSKILLYSNHQFTLKRSQQLFNKITKVLRNDCVLYNHFGVMIWHKYNSLTDARAIFVKSLSFNTSNSTHAITLFNVANIDQHHGNYTSAVTLLKQAINMNPLHTESYLILADLLIQAFMNKDEAKRLCIDAIKIQPENNELWQKLIQILYNSKDQTHRQGLNFNDMPNSCLFHVRKAYLLQSDRFKKYNQSIAVYQTVIQLCGDNNDKKMIFCKMNAIFNLASLLIDHTSLNDQQLNNLDHLSNLIQQVCTNLIKEFDSTVLLKFKTRWVGNFESIMIKFTVTNLINVDKSLVHETLGLYYESIQQYQQALMEFVMSIYHNDKNNNSLNTNDLIMVSHWKIGNIYSRFIKHRNITQIMQHFSTAIDESSQTIWTNSLLSELYYDFGYFFKTKMNDTWNATKYYVKSLQLNSMNIKAKEQLVETVKKNEDVLNSQFEKCSLCLDAMIDFCQSIHTTNCTHRFHTQCINKWYQKKIQKSCPLCRKPQPYRRVQ